MICNFFGTLVFACVLWGVGLAFLKFCGLTELSFKRMHLISMPVGLSVCALLANGIYIRMGLGMTAVRIVLLAVAAISGIYLFKKKISQQEMAGFLFVLAVFVVMTVPGWVQGDQYYIYRGNIWDQFFYYSEVIYMSRFPLKTALDKLPFVSDVLAYGQGSILTDRPTAPLMCAVLCGKGWGNVFFQAYLYMMLVWAMIIGPMMLMWEFLGKSFEAVDRKKEKIVAMIFSLLYIWGFYGQIQYDINAWSQMVSLSGLVAFVCVYGIFLHGLWEGKGLTGRRVLFLVIMGAGLFLIYPENTLLHGGILVAATVCLCIAKKYMPSLKELGFACLVPCGMLGIGVLLDPGTVSFALRQLETSGTDVRQGWAEFYDRYWLGYHPFVAGSPMAEAIKKLLALLPSQCGMFLLTPDYSIKIRVITVLWLGFLALVNLGLVLLFIRALWKAFCAGKERKSFYGFFAWFVFVGAGIFFLMMFKKQYWSAGKLLLYLSPELFGILAFEAYGFLMKRVFGKGWIRKGIYAAAVATSFLFLACQAFFAGMRAVDTFTNKDCTGYENANYPSDQLAVLKQMNSYSFNAKDYRGEEGVAIAIEDKFYQDYVKMALTYEGIPCYGIPDTCFATATYNENQRTVESNHRVIEKKDIFEPKVDWEFTY